MRVAGVVPLVLVLRFGGEGADVFDFIFEFVDQDAGQEALAAEIADDLVTLLEGDEHLVAGNLISVFAFEGDLGLADLFGGHGLGDERDHLGFGGGDDGPDDGAEHNDGQEPDEEFLADVESGELRLDLDEIFVDEIHGLHASLHDPGAGVMPVPRVEPRWAPANAPGHGCSAAVFGSSVERGEVHEEWIGSVVRCGAQDFRSPTQLTADH